MGSKRRQTHHLADSDDRISHLPESILGHILSRLPTKDAIATGAVSKRWRLLWTTIGNLDFCPNDDSEEAVEQFVKFVNFVMVLHKPSGDFNRLSLTWEFMCDYFYINTWIYAALAKDVHELIIRVTISSLPIHVQSYLFSSQNLRSLELSCGICIFSDGFVVSLPRLECLKLLSSVYFRSEEAFSKLLEGCPVLKYLVINIDIGKMISWGYIKIVDGVAFRCRISSTSLKHLELYARGDRNALCSVELDASSLECIKLKEGINSIVIRQRLNSLGDAAIQVLPADHKIEDTKYCNSVVEAIQALSCAKALNLCSYVIETLSRATIKMQTGFNRLTRLEVVMGDYWSSIQNFIELSDNLEVLIVNKDRDYYDENQGQFNNSSWTNPDVVPRCLSNSLRTVSIAYYDGCGDELAMVDYIIKNGSVLTIMQIRFGETFSGVNRKYELIKQIYTSPRKSTFCEFKFADYDSEQDAV